MSDKQRKPSASERLDALEKKILQYDAQIDEMCNVIDEVDRKFIALSKRVNASITATTSNDAVDELINQENAKELEGLTNILVKQGVLIPAQESEVSEKTFLVGRHISKEGNEVTPRLQFYVGSLVKEEQDKFIGKKVGDLIVSEDDMVSIEITELYGVKNPEQEIDFSKDNVKKPEDSKSKEDADSE